MLVEVGLEGESFAATAADVRLRVRVCLNVGPEVGLVGEGLVADGAFEWFFAWNKNRSY